MASIDEVWGKDFGRQPPKPLSSKASVVEKRDPVKEGRVAASPQERSSEAIQRHRKTIDDLSKSLPIATNDDELSNNYRGNQHAPVRESFTSQYAYAPPGFQQENTLVHLLNRIESAKSGLETNSTQDMMLYIFTGIFFLFTFDTFVNLGRRMKRR